MFKIKNIVMTLVFAYLMLLAIPQIAASSSDFDNSQFVSELTSEEKEEQKQQAIQDDYDLYMEQQELRSGYKDFSTIRYISSEEEFAQYEKELYDTMAADSSYSIEQKNEYYNLVLGDGTTPGLVDQKYDFEQQLRAYSEDDSIVVDATKAIEYIDSFAYPTPTISNVDYINMMSNIVTQASQLLEVINVSSATPEHLASARESNVEFTAKYNALNNLFEYYTLPRLSIGKKLLHSTVLMNIGAIVAIVVLFLVRFPIVKAQQIYTWDKFRPITLLVIPTIAILIFIFFSFMLSMYMPVESPTYSIYLNGEKVSSRDRIYLNESQESTLLLLNAGSDNSVASTVLKLNVQEGLQQTPSGSDIVVKQYGSTGTANFEAETGHDTINLPINENQFSYVTVKDAIEQVGISSSDTFEPDELVYPRYIHTRRNEFILPQQFALIWPSLLFGTLYFMFILMPGPMVKRYLEELYTINKFCGFLSYNMAYRSNARVLIEETLQSLEACKFTEDFAIIFFEKDRNMTDKIQDISQIYSYKFFEMYLGIVNIIFDEGVSDSTLKSLAIIQQFGDEYYNQADMFFKSKKGAKGSLMMIIAICMAMPFMVRKNTEMLFLIFANTSTGYTFTVGCYLVWFVIICLINNMYKNNKIVRQEGRYA